MKTEIDCVDWYIAVLEAGRNTKYIMEDYLRQKEELQNKLSLISEQKEAYETKLRRTKAKLKDVHGQLSKMFNDVVKPLLTEVKIKDEINERMRKEVEAHKRDLKLLNACIRMPAMCDQF